LDNGAGFTSLYEGEQIRTRKKLGRRLRVAVVVVVVVVIVVVVVVVIVVVVVVVEEELVVVVVKLKVNGVIFQTQAPVSLPRRKFSCIR
jgi:hypothetical protein